MDISKEEREQLYAGQVCFPVNGGAILLCNFIVRYNQRVYPKKKGGYLPIPQQYRQKKKKQKQS